MDTEIITHAIKLSAIFVMLIILVFGIHFTYVAVQIRKDILKKQNEISEKLDKLIDEVKLRCGTFLD